MKANIKISLLVGAIISIVFLAGCVEEKPEAPKETPSITLVMTPTPFPNFTITPISTTPEPTPTPREINLKDLPEGYPLSIDFGTNTSEDAVVFHFTNTGNITLKNTTFKFEKSWSGGLFSTMVFLGDIKPGETKRTKLDAQYLHPTRILLWSEDLKIWVIIWPMVLG